MKGNELVSDILKYTWSRRPTETAFRAVWRHVVDEFDLDYAAAAKAHYAQSARLRRKWQLADVIYGIKQICATVMNSSS